eukprot:scaffold3396_cov95-Skeletonema_dohrnii-CCMP3373.AAC.3
MRHEIGRCATNELAIQLLLIDPEYTDASSQELNEKGLLDRKGTIGQTINHDAFNTERSEYVLDEKDCGLSNSPSLTPAQLNGLICWLVQLSGIEKRCAKKATCRT